MARVKSGTNTRRRHNKVFELTKGFRMSKHRLIKSAKEASLHAGEYAFMGRKLKKRDFRRLWIVRINAALKGMGYRYSTFIAGLRENNIQVDRKILSYFAAEKPEIFKKIAESAHTKN